MRIIPDIMQIISGKVVLIDYTLTDDANTTLDTSKGREPLAYIHGSGQIIPGLEKALEGKTEGDNLNVRVAAEDAYGEKDDAKIVKVSRKQIQGVGDLKVGMQLQAAGEHGAQVVTIVSVEEDNVTLDANHPLAGQNLNFDVTITEVRDATAEEVAHGHVHGPGGHHH